MLWLSGWNSCSVQARRFLSSLHRGYPSRMVETKVGACKGDAGLHTQRIPWKDG